MAKTIAEIFKDNGIADETAQTVFNQMKENKIFTSGEENIDIRYGKLKKDFDELSKEHKTLKESNNANQGLSTKVSEQEAQIAQLQAELKQVKITAAMQVGLMKEGCKDIDYATFKLQANGDLELDENGAIKGWNDKISALKTQLPTQFEGAGTKKIIENKLPDDGNHEGSISKEEFSKMGYQERVKLFNENPDAYAELTQN